jgi:hypothetical protein
VVLFVLDQSLQSLFYHLVQLDLRSNHLLRL